MRSLQDLEALYDRSVNGKEGARSTGRFTYVEVRVACILVLSPCSFVMHALARTQSTTNLPVFVCLNAFLYQDFSSNGFIETYSGNEWCALFSSLVVCVCPDTSGRARAHFR